MASEVASGSGKQKFPFSLRGIVGRKEFGGAVIENNQHFFRIVRSSPNDPATTSQHPTIRVGVVFVGRQFPEGNSVLRGLLTALKASNRDNSLFGFKGGIGSFLQQSTVEIDDDVLSSSQNQEWKQFLDSSKEEIFDICYQWGSINGQQKKKIPLKLK